MLDEIARHNKERWEQLAQANIAYSRPALDLDETSARAMVDPEDMMGDAAVKDVLCLAGGGGQQSAAFALLGACVTVLDLSETQLERDRQAASHYGTDVRTIQGDMRDMTSLQDSTFDLVWHAHSLNFVPDARQVYREVARVLRPGGLYRLECTNPFIHGTWEKSWDGNGYPLHYPYLDGAEVVDQDPYWDVDDGAGNVRRVIGPHEFRHALSTLVNGLIACGFVLLGLWEDAKGDPDAAPGTWRHFKTVAPPWLSFRARLSPDAPPATPCAARAPRCPACP